MNIITADATVGSRDSEQASIKSRTDERTVRVSVIYPDSSVEHVALEGSDATLFAAIRLLTGGSPTALPINDYDGLAATGWVNEIGAASGLRLNRLAGELVDQTVVGPMVVTGLGRGETDCVTSVHEGLRRVLDRKASAPAR